MNRLYHHINENKQGGTHMTLLTVNEAAERLNLSPWTIRSWITGKRLDCVRLGRAIRVPVEAVEGKIREGLRKADI